jgi:putative ABC transport system ATP-binding protein
VGLGLRVHELQLAYGLPGGGTLLVLDIDRIRVPSGAAVGIMGPSGSGKTSLLHALTGLERPQRGAVTWDGVDIAALPERARDRWRRRSVGIVFQDFHLFPGMTAIDNVLLPATFSHVRIPGQLRERARMLLARVGLEDRAARSVAYFSRGEMQRVGIARALLFSPPLVVVDEPTANLDRESGQMVTGLILSLCRETDSTLLAVSHDVELLGRLEQVFALTAGRLAPADPMALLS